VALRPKRIAGITRVTRDDGGGRGRYGNAKHQRLPQEQTGDIAAPGAERQPDADLPGPLGRHLRDHAVDPHDAEHERDARRNPQSHERLRCLPHRLAGIASSARTRPTGQVRIHRPDGLLDLARNVGDGPDAYAMCHTAASSRPFEVTVAVRLRPGTQDGK
jgi:hypothetical protein